MNLAIFVLQLTQDDAPLLTQDYIEGAILIVMLVILVLATTAIMWSLWWGRPRRHRSHYW